MQNFIRNCIKNGPNNYHRLKQYQMEELKMKQVHYESSSWKRLVSFMIDENIHMKNRLSEVLTGPFNYNLLDHLEAFQTRFIQADVQLSLIRHNLAELEQVLAVNTEPNQHEFNGTSIKLKTLRNNIVNTEKIFVTLEADFNNYLFEYI